MQRMAERELDAAEEAFGRDDWATVLQHVDKALRLDPDNQDAIELRDAVEGARAGSIESSLAAATTAAQNDDWARVLEHAETALVIDPDNADARELRDVAERAVTGGDRTRVFVSSAMEELRAERDVVEATLRHDRYFDPWLFDRDASARDHSAQDEWRTQLERRGVGATVVLLWKKLGEWTLDEIEVSRTSGVATLLFLKEDPEDTLHREHGDYLRVLTHPGSDSELKPLTSKSFRSPAVIGKLVVQSLNDLVKDRLDPHRKDHLDADEAVAGVRYTAQRTEVGYRSDETPIRDAQRLDAGLQRILAPHVGVFVDRRTDVKKLTTLLRSRQFRIVGVTGPPGIGKTALLRRIADDDVLAAEFGDGVAIHPDIDLISLSNRTPVPADSSGSDAPSSDAGIRNPLEDLLQAVWEQFFDADPSTVRPDIRRRQLGAIQAVIVLPEADAAIGHIEQLAEFMPRSVFCVTLEQPLLREGHMALGGLIERTDIVALCSKVDGNPSRIRLLASKAFDEAFHDEDAGDGDHAHPLNGWAASLDRMDRQALQRELVAPAAAEVGAVVATTESPTPRAVLAATVGSMASVDEADAHGALVKQSPRYRLNPVLDETVAPESEILPQLFDNTVGWAQAVDTAEIYANREFVLEMLRWGTEQERWDQVIRLGRAAEPAMVVGGRHGAWAELLDTVADAARSSTPVDREALGWALHQLGTRALLRDDLRPARWLLHRAFRARPEHDRAGREVTHHNMSLVPGAITPVTFLASAVLVVTSWLAAVLPAASPGEPSAIADVEPDVQEFESGEEFPFRLRNAGDTPFTIGSLQADGFTISRPTCLDEPLAPGAACEFTITFTSDRDAVESLDFDLTAESGNVAGDQTVLLVGRLPDP